MQRPLCDIPWNALREVIVSRNPRRRLFCVSTKSRFEINGGWFVYIVWVVCETNLLIYDCVVVDVVTPMLHANWILKDTRNAHALLAVSRNRSMLIEDEAKSSTTERRKSINSGNQITRNNEKVTHKSDLVLVNKWKSVGCGWEWEAKREIRALRSGCSYFNCTTFYFSGSCSWNIGMMIAVNALS